jgi:hypothetical protein
VAAATIVGAISATVRQPADQQGEIVSIVVDIALVGAPSSGAIEPPSSGAVSEATLGAPHIAMPLATADPSASGLSRLMHLTGLLLPLSALLAGRAAPRSRLASGIAFAGGFAAAAGALPLAVAGRRVPPAARELTAGPIVEPQPTAPWLSVLIPARDEAAVIGALVADLGRQDHRAVDGSALFDVTIVDDRSTDATGSIAAESLSRAGLAAVSRVVRRDAPCRDGKGAALASVPVAGLRGEAVVVLDADGRIGPDFLRLAAAHIAAGADAVTARRRMLRPESGRLSRTLARLQDDEQTLDGEIQLGRWALGGASELRGDGMVVRTDVLAAVGGWGVDALCEDLELSTRLFAHDRHGVVWARDIIVWEEPVLGLRPLLRQRLRWAEGLVRRDLRETMPVLVAPGLGAWQRLDMFAYLCQSLMPFAALGLALTRDSGARRRLALLASAYVVGAGGLAWDALRWSRTPDGSPPPAGQRLVRSLGAVAWSGSWLLVLPVAHARVILARGPLRFAKSVHGGRFEPLDDRPSGDRASRGADRPSASPAGHGISQ